MGHAAIPGVIGLGPRQLRRSGNIACTGVQMLIVGGDQLGAGPHHLQPPALSRPHAVPRGLSHL